MFSPLMNSRKKFHSLVWRIAVAISLPSLLMIDFLNANTNSRLHWIGVLINCSYWMIPWGLAYLFAFRYRGFLKAFAPLYISLILFSTTFPLGANEFSQRKKFHKVSADMLNRFVGSLTINEPPSIEPPGTYSTDEYGRYASYLYKIERLMRLSQEENLRVIEAVNEVEINKVLTDDTLFSFQNIILKKKQLKRLLDFLDESAQRIEDIHLEFTTWMISSSDLNEASRKEFADTYYKTAEEKKFIRQEPYRIQKEIIQECIQLLDYLCKIYGAYRKDLQGRVIFDNDKDLKILRSHIETIETLSQEGQKMALDHQKAAMNISQSYSLSEPKNNTIQSSEKR
ncbi:MAG TPA: hypothetical protein PKW79_00670 [Rhabdochlamydiaceae bacterium]|nr:hypothetical protein [Rhabdochlamydiaceae bacterium]